MLYDNGGLTRQATVNEKNAADARELADMKARQQSQGIYEQGANDAYSAVERRLMEQAQQQEMDRRMQEGYNNYQRSLQEQNTGPSLYDQVKGRLGSMFTSSEQPAQQSPQVSAFAERERLMEEDRLNKLAQEADRTAQGYK